MRAWIARKWAQFKQWFYGILVALGIVAGGITLAIADDISLSWVNGTQFEDGTTMTIDDIDETVLYRQGFPLGADLSAEVRSYTELVRLPPTVTSYVDANLPDGIYCYVGTHVAGGVESIFSGEACKPVDTRTPGTLTGLTAN
jgi:hypothetical protein